MEEIVQALVETHALAGERGQYRLGRLVEGLQIPDRVQAVLAARIDRLSGESKAVLQAGAAIGVDVPVALLQAVANASSEEVLHALAELEAADFVRPSALVPDLAYSFKHAITQEVAYATLLKEQRRALHARIVAALEASYPGERRAEHVERLAYHALRAEAWPTAVGYLRDAGERAVARSANREAAAFYEDALRALAHLPESRDTFALAIDLRLDLRVPLLQLGRLDDLHRLSKEAESMAQHVGDEERLARAYSYLVNYHYLLGEPARADEYGARCLAIAGRRRDPELAMLAGAVWYTRGQLDRAMPTLARGLEICRDANLTVWQPIPTTLLGACLLALDRKDDGLALLRDGVRRAESLGVMAYLSRWTLQLAEGLLVTGDVAGARVTAA